MTIDVSLYFDSKQVTHWEQLTHCTHSRDNTLSEINEASNEWHVSSSPSCSFLWYYTLQDCSNKAITIPIPTTIAFMQPTWLKPCIASFRKRRSDLTWHQWRQCVQSLQPFVTTSIILESISTFWLRPTVISLFFITWVKTIILSLILGLKHILLQYFI